MAQQVVRRLIIESEERGAAQAAAALDKLTVSATKVETATERWARESREALAPAAAAAGKASDTLARATLASARAIEGLHKRVDPAYRALQELERAQKLVSQAMDAGTISTERGNVILAAYQERYRRLSGTMEGANDNIRLSTQQMQGLGYQINDIGTMLAMGASPFQVMASQAGQVVQTLQDGPGGVRGSLRAMGAQLVGLAASIGPVGLGFAAAGVAVAGFTYAFRQDFPDMEETLSTHADLIERIGEKYEGLVDRIKDVRDEAAVGLGVELGAVTRDLNALIEQEMRSLDIDFTSYLGQALFGALDFANAPTSSKFAPITQAVDAFREELKAGTADAVAFQRTLAEMHEAAGDDAEMRKAIEAAFRYSQELANLQTRARETVTALEEMNRQPTALEILKEQDPDAFKDLRDGLKEQTKALEEATRAAETYREALTGQSESINQTIGGLQAQIRLFGESSGALAAERFETEQLAAARQAAAEAGVALTDTQIANIRQAAQDVGRLTDALEAMREARFRNEAVERLYGKQSSSLRSLQLEAETIGMAEEARERLRASLEAEEEVRSAGIDVLSREAQEYIRNAEALAGYESRVKRVSAAWDDARRAGEDAIDGVVDSLMSGDLSGALEGVLADIAKTALELGVKNPLKNALLGTNYGTLSDLFAGGIEAPTLAAPTMAPIAQADITAAVVNLQGGIVNGAGGAIGAVGSLAGGVTGSMSAYREAIAAIESRGSGGYSALGPWTKGDRAYGRYQVMGANIGPWSEQALGRSLSIDEFMANPKFQDAIFNHVFGGYVSQYGATGAAQAWFGGPGSVGKGGLTDDLGTSISEYAQRFEEELAKLPDVGSRVSDAANTFGNSFEETTTGVNQRVAQVGQGFAGEFGGVLQQLLGVVGGAVGGQGGGLISTIGSSLLGLIPGFADGTEFAPGGMALVGERGPELVNLPRGARVIPNERVRVPHLTAAPSAASSMQRQGLHITVGASVDENGTIRPFVEKVSRQEAANATRAGIGQFSRALPEKLPGMMSRGRMRAG